MPPAREVPLEVIRFFTGEKWRKESLEWAARRINESLLP